MSGVLLIIESEIALRVFVCGQVMKIDEFKKTATAEHDPFISNFQRKPLPERTQQPRRMLLAAGNAGEAKNESDESINHRRNLRKTEYRRNTHA